MFEVNEDSFTITISKTVTISIEHVQQLIDFKRKTNRTLSSQEIANTYNIPMVDAIKVLSYMQ